ncbi:DUF305 domain-containing protein [Streptomyces spongiae]|uniref:DUF305 domain-containing protein n=1 Tax=Streptomyces spongiae TaxID=565072 RepID=A0A5N8XNG5_9ACTN|nr:DUF305 domain-containing protein [Streptomyces spongiae]MPY61040.1 DUF305 domain-containing protein [Streptomyces spongiae]
MTMFTRALRPNAKPARRLAAVCALSAGALLLTACGGGDDMGGMDHGGGKSSASAEAGSGSGAGSASFNDADVAFAQMMIPHHEQALEMARLADGRASDETIKDIAAKVEQAQDPEIRTMTGWLTSWKQPTAVESMPGMEHGGDGMMSEADMTGLKAMKGADFDKMFAEMMIEHHEGAISTAKAERAEGKNADAKKLAEAVVTTQSAEIKQLKGILEQL